MACLYARYFGWTLASRIAPSSSGRTTVFGTVNVGSNPAGAAKVGSEVMSIISAVVRLNNFEGFMIEVC